jgi:hypothetical protein
LPSAVLDQAEILAQKAGLSTIQEYCTGLLRESIEVERVKSHMVEVEAKRGPLEGFKEVTGDPDYLAEWRERSGSRESAAGKSQAPNTTQTEGGNEAVSENHSPGTDRQVSDDRLLVRLEPSPRVIEAVRFERYEPEVVDGTAIDAILTQVGSGVQEPHAFLPCLRRGQPPSSPAVADLMAVLGRIETDQQGATMLDRRLAYALYRLALESQVLLTEAWPGIFDERTIGAIRAVQEMVERVLSAPEIRYYEARDGQGAENST